VAEGDKVMTIGLSRELHRNLKMAAVLTDIPMKEIVLRAIQNELVRIKADIRGDRSQSRS
jgi:hypothetical protein